MRIRRGVSLVELLVVMSACSVILTMSASLIHRAMRTHAQTRAFFNVERSAMRLFEQFRRDVHLAINCTIDATAQEGSFLRIELFDGTIIEYRRQDESIFRTVSEHDETLAREDFSFSAAMDLTIREEDLPRRLILSISTQVQESKIEKGRALETFQSLPTVCQAEVIVGRDLRFAPVGGDREVESGKK